jgi:DNA modification methylase
MQFGKREIPIGLKPKDLIGVPWRVAFALQADGWYLRADLPWIKRNSMPSSVTDRPASSIEHVFLLSKSKKYYYDHIATMQPSSESYNNDKRPRGKLRQCVNPNGKYPDEGQFKKQDNVGNNTYTGFNARYADSGTGLRFMRDSDFFFRTWQGLLHNEDGEPMALVVNPRGYKGAHFACFPVLLIEPMILAGTSEKGVCAKCGAPWIRITEKGAFRNQSWGGEHVKAQDAVGGVGLTSCMKSGGTHDILTTGWQPTCTCSANSIPATVLDPFAGSSATGVACKWHNRNYIGIELNPDYCKLGEQRIKDGK